MTEQELLNHPLYLAIIERPSDWAAYLVLADFCWEQGFCDESFGLRWMGHNEKCPTRRNDIWFCFRIKKEFSGYLEDLPPILVEYIRTSCFRNLLEGAREVAKAVKTLKKILGDYHI